jgi:hypothetical protein
LPDGAASVAALMACASSAGAFVAALALALDLAFAATDIVSTAAAQMKTTATDLPTGATRRVHIAPNRLLAPRTAQSRTSARIPIVSS